MKLVKYVLRIDKNQHTYQSLNWIYNEDNF